ncbi:cyclic-di-AMP-binding protein CbpB [Secundilactobacillus malefermentans]|uniref:cyclic-di-AMP-binding protein CbpB n=1 Tax=Secundilactobacillus malefermentans TaxID=176292 RepID=UPI0011CADA9D|nr:cyclic-di-AMP-binding protein CbpB [Secundilactobacillus malefermentans]QEA32225.1 CBS domain-containing protein [Secundilactobacillus malefermentans]
MLDKAVETLLRMSKDSYIIPGDVVANVSDTNNCYHALLVLTQTGYSKIPVLNNKEQFCGFVSLAMVTKQMMESDRMNPDRLMKIPVSEIMESDVAVVEDPNDLEQVLNRLINEPFLPVVNEDRIFTGIITRREILKRVNFLAHNLEDHFQVSENTDK